MSVARPISDACGDLPATPSMAAPASSFFQKRSALATARVNEFQDGAFRVAQQLEIPIVPVSIVGSIQHHRTGHWMFWPATISVHLHDTIDTSGMSKEEVPGLREHVRDLVKGSVEEPLKNAAEEKSDSAETETTN